MSFQWALMTASDVVSMKSTRTVGQAEHYGVPSRVPRLRQSFVRLAPRRDVEITDNTDDGDAVPEFR